MKYPKLNSLVPQGEHFDESAISGEGVWLSTKHVDSIESFLASDTVSAIDLVTANDTIKSLNDQISAFTDTATTTGTTVTTQAARIKELEGQVAELGKKSSGTPGGTTIITNADQNNTENKPIPSYLDDNNPANQFADKRVKRQTTK